MSRSEVYTTADVAEMLRFSPKTIREWCARGVFPGAEKHPNDEPRSEWRIPAADIEAYKRRKVEREPVPRDRLDELMDAAMAKSA